MNSFYFDGHVEVAPVVCNANGRVCVTVWTVPHFMVHPIRPAAIDCRVRVNRRKFPTPVGNFLRQIFYVSFCYPTAGGIPPHNYFKVKPAAGEKFSEV